ncbi:MAG: BatA domain-containing protein [Rhodospirillaceae bacterium]
MPDPGTLAFAAPELLFALLGLPVVWWLLRLTPPAPQRVMFPALRLLRDPTTREETPAHTPWWLLALRVLITGLAIIALAGPVLNPGSALPGTGPLVLVIDDGWAAALHRITLRERLATLLTRAERQTRPVIIVTTAPAPTLAGPMPAAEAHRLALGLEPHPWPSDRSAALNALKTLTLPGGVHSIWLSDGLDAPGTRPLMEYLRHLGTVDVLTEPAASLPDLLLPPAADEATLTARVVRAAPGPERTVQIRLSAGDGRLLALESARFAAEAVQAEVRFELPLELRNQAERLTIDQQATAGATVLLDERWRRRPVGLVSPRSTGAEARPLLGDLYYLDKAMAPFSEVRRGTVADLLAGGVAMLVLADSGAPGADETRALEDWIDKGGVLVRFAGPQLARAPDALLPVRLRPGDRALGGALSWTKPAHLADFDPGSPFAGLAVSDEVTVTRQVLAEPSLETTGHTWARLTDGTPLVTAAQHGRGTLVLVHTTAGPDWSNLALSGLFVDMLRRLTALSTGIPGGSNEGVLAPLTLLDGSGRLGAPPADALPIPAGNFAETRVGPQHPPGFYGRDDRRRALNLTTGTTSLRPLPPFPGITVSGYAGVGETELKPGLLAMVFLLLLTDMAIALRLRGQLSPGWRRLQ